MWKAIYQGEGQGEGGLGRTQHRGGWWEASDRALKTEGCHEGKPTLGVTPAILSVDIALGMQQEIEQKSVPFLRKPFSKDDLLDIIQRIL